MPLFGRRQVPPEPGLVAQVMELRSLVENLSSEVRTLRFELAAQSDLVTKRMRRAVAAERAVERNQDREGATDAAPPSPIEPPARRLNLWGARGRRLARRQLAAHATPPNGDAPDAEE